MEGQRFSTVMCEGLGAALEVESLSLQRELVLECAGLEVGAFRLQHCQSYAELMHRHMHLHVGLNRSKATPALQPLDSTNHWVHAPVTAPTIIGSGQRVAQHLQAIISC